MKKRLFCFLLVAMLVMMPLFAYATVKDVAITNPVNNVYLRTNGTEAQRQLVVNFTVLTNQAAMDVPNPRDRDVETEVALLNSAGTKVATVTKTTLSTALAKVLDSPVRYAAAESVTLTIPATVGQGVYRLAINSKQKPFPDRGAWDVSYTSLASYVIVDNTAPIITFTSPAANTLFTSGSTVVISGTVNDPNISDTVPGSRLQSAVMTITGPNSYSTGVITIGSTWSYNWLSPSLNDGTYTIHVKAVDNVGNERIVTRTVHIGAASQEQPGTFGDFIPPLTKKAFFKIGSTIPVKLKWNGDTAPANVKLTLVLYKVAGSQLTELTPASPGKSNKGQEFRYSGNGNEKLFIYNLNTKGLTAGTYRIVVRNNSGTMVGQIDITLKGK